MEAYTSNEITDMVLAYGAANSIAVAARRLYCERFPNRRVPSARYFDNVVQRLRETGSVKSEQDRRAPTDRILALEPNIIDQVEADPSISTRRLAHQLGVSHYTVWRTLRDDGLYPYHVQKVQALVPGDAERRVEFCEWLQQKCAQIPDFLKLVLFTDEAGFTRNGVFNTRNTHCWSVENPHAIVERRHQRQFSINVWAGIVDGQLIGPYVLPNRLNGRSYLDFLQTVLPNLLDDVPLATLRSMWYMHDGAPPHYARAVAMHLNQEFGNRWIERNGPVIWPARSPDLNPCDFFLWGHMKARVYAEPINSSVQLTQHVHQAAAEIRGDPAVFGRIRQSLQRRAEICIANGGLHFEHLL